VKTFFTLLLFCLVLSSKAAKISGKITDSQNGELLVGASIVLQPGNFQASSGLDGSFTINHVPEGEYILEVVYIGYERAKQEVAVKEGEEKITINITMVLSDASTEEVVVTAENDGSDFHARSLEKESGNVLNVVSAKQIQLSPDITVANVIQRVSGLSIERNASGDPQYAIIRGMDKRYNNTLINGVKIPSPDNENRYVPLDIFPAIFLERLEVYKSLTANMEADAIGGTVNMVMRSAPSKMLLNADMQLGYNKINLDQKFNTYDRSNLNRRSPKELFGDNYRAVPNDFPVENMIVKPVQALPDVFANLSYGNRFFKKKLGLMTGASFQNSYRPVSNYFYEPMVNTAPGNPIIMDNLIVRETSSQLQRIAFHGKVDYNFNTKHSMSLYVGKYLLNEFRVREQIRTQTFVAVNNNAVYPVTRFSNIFQDITIYDLRGNHQLLRKLKMDWSGVYSMAKNDRPDDGVFARAGTYEAEKKTVTNEIVYFQGIRNSRAWERNQDNDLSAYLNFVYRPGLINERTEIQFGGLGRMKTRNNFYNYYNYAQVFGQFKGVDWNDFGDVEFRAMANPRGSGDRSNLVYDASENIYAAYVNTSLDFVTTKVQVGVRAEQTTQGYEIDPLAASANNTLFSKDTSYLHFFPSASLKQRLTAKSNLKATYFKGISRPGFYEIVPTIRSAGGGDGLYSERGNANLGPSIGHSADLRYEFFPSGIDQILFGVFYKKIIDPIEFGFPRVQGAGDQIVLNQILPQNFDDAINYGLEADLMKYFSKFGLRVNYTFTNSEITTNKIILNQNGSSTLINQTRPLQGQSKHIGNMSLLWKDIKNKFDAQIVLNYTGERIAVVSPFYGADHYMKPMTQLDLSVEKGIGKHWVVFVKVNNLLNTPYELYVKKPMAFPTDPYPYQTDPYNISYVRRDLYGQSLRLGVRFNLAKS